MLRKCLFILLLSYYCLFVSEYVYGQHPSLIKHLKHKAKYNYSQEKYHLALDDYLKLDSLQESDDNIKYKTGVCLFETGYENRSCHYFEQADTLEKDFEKRYFYLARCKHLNHRFDSAIHYYQQYRQLLKTSKNAEQEIAWIDFIIEKCHYGKELIKTPLEDIDIEIVSSGINSAYSDHAPLIAADEQLMVFTSCRPGSMGDQRDPVTGEYYEDIYISEKQGDGNWSEAENMGEAVNTDHHDASIGLSPDGRTLIFYRSKGKKTGNIYIMEKRRDKWSEPVSIGKNINSEYWDPSASISKDEKTLYFSSNRPGGYGGTDIYVSHRLPNNEWGEPENMGKPVNTKYDDDAPFIMQNGEVLYFSSKGHKGMGGFDVFKTRYDEEKEAWGEPENAGYPINTGGDDIYFVWNKEGTVGYFASKRSKGYGNTDIYKVNRSKKTEPEVALKGRIVNKRDTSRSVTAMISVLNKEKDQIENVVNSSPETGRYMVMLKPGIAYQLKIESRNFIPKNMDMKIAAGNGGERRQKDIKLEPIADNKKMVLEQIYFTYDKAELTNKARNKLDRYMTFLSQDIDYIIEVQGHTDSIGSDKYNKVLSQKRAEAVVKYMVQKGMNANKLKAVGYGESKPVADNGTKKGRAQNRRTTFKFLKNKPDDVMIKPDKMSE